VATINLAAYKPTAGTASDAALIDNAFDAIQTGVNGIDNNNIAASAGINLSKLAQDSALTGQRLGWNGTAWVPVYLGLYRKTTEKDVVNTTVETDLLNGEVTIGAGVLGTTGAVRVTAVIDYLNNTGSNQNLTWKVKLGATTIFGDLIVRTTNANRNPWWLTFVIANLGSASSQALNGILGFAGTVPPTVAGIGGITGGVPGGIIGGTATEDTTSAKALAVTVTHGAASASLSCRLKYAVVEIV
jgi:hypothetical protein